MKLTTTITEKAFVLKVTEHEKDIITEHFYSSDYIADLLRRATELREWFGDDVEMDLVDTKTGEVLYGQYEAVNHTVEHFGPIVKLITTI